MMISAWLFLAGMYLHLILSVAVPASILLAGKYEFMGHGFIDALLAFYFFVIAAVHVTGWICVAAAVSAGRKGQLELLYRGGYCSWGRSPSLVSTFCIASLFGSCL